jgi:MFS family permease
VNAYLLGYTAVLPLLARAADVRGIRAIFVVSCLLFVAGSLWAALAGGVWSLVAARAVQAVGGGGLVPVALAAAAILFTGRERLLALGIVAGAAEAGAVLGPLYGAGVLEAAGWRWVFWLNLPLTLFLLVAAWPALRLPAPVRGRVDVLGAVLAGLALVCLTIGLAGETLGDRPALLAAAGVLVALSALRLLRVDDPLLPPQLLRARPFASANGSSLLAGAALVVALVEIPLFATVVLDRTATAGGLTLLQLTALIPVGALLGGWLGGRVPIAWVAAAGMVASAGGFVRLSRWDEAAAEPWLTLDVALTGLGFGLVLAPFAASVLAPARGGHEATAAASLTISRMVGMTVALAALTTWGLAEFDRRVAGTELPLRRPGESDAGYDARLERYERVVTEAAIAVFSRVFLVAAALCLLAALAAAWLRDERPRLSSGP